MTNPCDLTEANINLQYEKNNMQNILKKLTTVQRYNIKKISLKLPFLLLCNVLNSTKAKVVF